MDEGLVEVPIVATRLRAGLAVWFLAVLCATATVDRSSPVAASVPVGEERRQLDAERAAASPWDGGLARRIEHELEATSRSRRALAAAYTAALYRWIGEAHGSTAVVGRAGWLFVAHRTVPPPTESKALLSRWSAQLAALDRRLTCLGVHAVFLPLPRRAVVCADRLPAGVDPRADLDRDAAGAPRDVGVDVVALSPGYMAWEGPPLFYRADAHWNELGEKLAAELVAAHLGVGPDAPRRTELRSAGVETQGARTDNNKDLYRFVGIDPDGPWMPSLRGPDVPMFDILDGNGYALKKIEAPRPMRRVALTGTSYSARRDFSRMLHHALAEPVFDASKAASGPVIPILDLLRDHAGSLPRTLIVEMPVYSMFEWLTMSDIGPILVEFPPPRTEPLDVPLALGELLVLGEEIEIGPWRTLVEVEGGRLVSSGDGVALIRLRGEVLEGRVRLSDEKQGLWGYNWEPGREELLLPIVAANPSGRPARILVRSLDRKRARLRIDDAALVTTLDVRGGTVLHESSRDVGAGDWTLEYEVPGGGTWPRGRGLYAEPAGPVPPEMRMRLEAVDEEGVGHLLGGARPAPGARVVLSHAGLVGREVRSIRMLGWSEEAPVSWTLRVVDDCGAER